MAPLRATLVERLQASGFTRVESEAGLAMIDTEKVARAPRLRSASDLRALRVPVLAVFGTLDPLVVASQEAPAARTALASNPRSQVVLDGLSHWFQEGATTGTVEESAALGPNLGSPRLVSLVGAGCAMRSPDPACDCPISRTSALHPVSAFASTAGPPPANVRYRVGSGRCQRPAMRYPPRHGSHRTPFCRE